jgi:hypothetical protein
LLHCFVFAFVLTATAQAQPPAPTPEEYLQGDSSIGIPSVDEKDTGWVEPPVLDAVPRWLSMPWMYDAPQAGVEAPIFNDTELGAQIHYGDNGSPAEGYPHREASPAHYAVWYRPFAYDGLDVWKQPLSFNPRGYGTPQKRAPYRVDYAPYVMSTTATQYGPYYYPRFRDFQDPGPDCDDDCCDSRSCRKRSFWLLDY